MIFLKSNLKSAHKLISNHAQIFCEGALPSGATEGLEARGLKPLSYQLTSSPLPLTNFCAFLAQFKKSENQILGQHNIWGSQPPRFSALRNFIFPPLHFNCCYSTCSAFAYILAIKQNYWYHDQNMVMPIPSIEKTKERQLYFKIKCL